MKYHNINPNNVITSWTIPRNDWNFNEDAKTLYWTDRYPDKIEKWEITIPTNLIWNIKTQTAEIIMHFNDKGWKRTLIGIFSIDSYKEYAQSEIKRILEENKKLYVKNICSLLVEHYDKFEGYKDSIKNWNEDSLELFITLMLGIFSNNWHWFMPIERKPFISLLDWIDIDLAERYNDLVETFYQANLLTDNNSVKRVYERN